MRKFKLSFDGRGLNDATVEYMPRLFTAVPAENQDQYKTMKELGRLLAASPALLDAVESVMEWMLDAESETGKPLGDGLGYKARMHKSIIVAKLKAALELAKNGDRP